MNEQKQQKRIGVTAPHGGMEGRVAIELAKLNMNKNVEIVVIDNKKVSEGFIPKKHQYQLNL